MAYDWVRIPVLAASVLAVLTCGACGGGDDGNGNGNGDGGAGSGDGDGGGNGDGNGDGGQQCGTLLATIHDFKPSGTAGGHPDFEPGTGFNGALVTGLVKPTLGSAGVPELQTGLSTQTKDSAFIHEATDFAKWYVDDATNDRIEQQLPLTETPAGSGVYVFSSDAYFPIDGMGFGNYQCPNGGPNHNYHFTTRLNAEFQYKGGETFEFVGDDDVWVFINGALVIDIGGIHGAEMKSVNLDTLGLTAGQTYTIDFFQAERHCVGSNFKITTSIACFTGGGVIL